MGLPYAPPTTTPPEPLVASTADAMTLLQVGRTTLYNLMDSGEIDAVKIGSRTLITRESIDAYLERLVEQGRPKRYRLADRAKRPNAQESAAEK